MIVSIVPLRIASALFIIDGVGFGVFAVPAIVRVLQHRPVPVVFGFPAYGGGPFERVGKILQQDSTVATGAGHHSVLHSPSGKWYIVYHRRPLGETDRNHRVVSIDEMHFDERGLILPVKITTAGVQADPLPAGAARKPHQ